MKCECDLCIHNLGGQCQNEERYIDSHGACSECVLVEIAEEQLTRLKQAAAK